MHRAFFVWTPTPLLLRRRTPRPGPVLVCVCVCVLFLAGPGEPASRARFDAPHPACGRFVLPLRLAPSGLGLPRYCPFVCLLSCLCSFFSFLSLRPRCILLSLVSGPRCPWPWRCVPPPLFFLFFPGFCRGPLGLIFVFSRPHSPLPPPFYGGFLCPPPSPLVFFVGLPLLGPPCAPLLLCFLPGLWLLPCGYSATPPPGVCFVVVVAAAR